MLRVGEQDLDDLAAVEDRAPQGGVGRQRAEAVVRDQTQPAAFAQSLDPVCKEHPVGVAIAGSDRASLPVRLTLAVESSVDLLLVLRLPSAVGRVPDDRVELDLIDRSEVVDLLVEPGHTLSLCEELTLPLR